MLQGHNALTSRWNTEQPGYLLLKSSLMSVTLAGETSTIICEALSVFFV